MATKCQGCISSSAACLTLPGKSFLFDPFALEALGSALVQLALERPALCLLGGRQASGARSPCKAKRSPARRCLCA